MEKLLRLPILLILGAILLTSCSEQAPKPGLLLSTADLIPLPTESADASGSVPVLNLEITTTSLSFPSSETEWLAGATSESQKTAVAFVEDTGVALSGYSIEILADKIEVHYRDEAGAFYGLQTLRQLVEFARSTSNGFLGQGRVQDQPRYAYRGAMLDIARHFHGPEEIKRVIRMMAQYKMNALHLHLTDDQGWRIEIKKYPRLTEIGGSTEVGGQKGGFLTQAQYAELVAYAKTYHVSIIPEIDMPGHTQAALVSYPELNCNPKDPNPELYEGTEVGFSSFCIGKPEVMTFVKDVLTELAAITPGSYLHIGGDESHATDSMDYRAFIAEVEPIVRGLGKRLIGWDEVVTAGIDKSAVVQYWHSVDNAKQAIENGHMVLMSPAKHAYLDMQYDSTSRIGLHWAAYIEVDEAYNWDPAEVVEGLDDQYILGVEAPLWTETVVTRADIDYLMFPRLLGYAEIGWTHREKRDWNTYQTRLARHGARLKQQGVSFYESEKVSW